MQEFIAKLKDEIEKFGDATDMIDEVFGEEDALKLFFGEAMVSAEED